MVRGCGTGVVAKQVKRGLHQTHLRGRPNSLCQKLDCGEACFTVSSRVPRRALEIQPYRGVGQVPDSKRRAHPVAADVSPCGAGDAVTGVLVVARLDARAAIAQILRFVVTSKGHGPGANQNDRVGLVTHGESQA